MTRITIDEMSEDVVLLRFLRADQYVDYSAEIIQLKAAELFHKNMNPVAKARIAYEFVRDEIAHSFDINADVITAKASDVLRYGTGICHAKANLLAALLRSQGIPTGFRFQRLTLGEDESQGYCVHAYNAVLLGGRWIELDARGNSADINAQFSLDEPKLAFQARPEYEECFYEGIYASPHPASMQMLEKVKSIAEIRATIPDCVMEFPDILLDESLQTEVISK